MLPEVCQSRPIQRYLKGSASSITTKARVKARGLWQEPEVLPVPDRQQRCACMGQSSASSIMHHVSLRRLTT